MTLGKLDDLQSLLKEAIDLFTDFHSYYKNLKKLIFNEFYQDKSSGVWPVRGSGLGLKLVKDYVNIHHGVIRLLKPNKKFPGARFLVRLPVNQNM